MSTKFIDMTGQKFGRLTVVRRGENQGLKVRWLCVCECGGSTLAQRGNLMSGITKSCGCLRREVAADRSRSHGMTGTKEMIAYIGAKKRCTDPKYKSFDRYGGRGIEFRFNSFEEWLEELGLAPGPEYSVDRINPNGHYEPGNLRWATWKQQAANKTHCKTCTCVPS